MPHLFANRDRMYALTGDVTDPHTRFLWESLNAVLYKLGGGIFMAGSLLFFPRFAAYQDLGAWLFFAGSQLYLVVTLHDLLEALAYRRRSLHKGRRSDLELLAAAVYLVGTLLFTVGSVFFLSQIGWFAAGAWCFVVGSLLFVVGASINILLIVHARTLVTMQLMNLTAVAFVVGSVLFAVASVPYLWTVEDRTDRLTLYAFLAWQYLVGSGLFLLGGLFNYWRATLIHREERHASGRRRLLPGRR